MCFKRAKKDLESMLIEKSNGMSINDINISDYLKFSTSAKNDLKRNLEVLVFRKWKTYDHDCFGRWWCSLIKKPIIEERVPPTMVIFVNHSTLGGNE